MTPQEVKQQLEKIWKSYTSAYDTISREDALAFEMATNALGAIEQIQWERDLAIKQLHDLGYGLGEKPREDGTDINVGDMISREELFEELNSINLPVGDETVDKIFGVIENIPSAQPEISRIEQELHGKTPEEQYEFLYWLLLKFGLAYTDSRLAVIEWLRGEKEDE